MMSGRSTLMALSAALTLSGCTAIRYKPVHTDSPRPISQTANCKISATDPIKHLMEGEQCIVLVQANQWFSFSNLSVLPNETYQVTVPSGQVWFDLNRRNAPPRGDKGSWLMNILASQKRHVGADWFSLIAVTVSADEMNPIELPGRKDLSISGVLKTRYPGRLAFYPNDAIGPAEDPTYYYKNNAGQIWVLVQRIQMKDSQVQN